MAPKKNPEILLIDDEINYCENIKKMFHNKFEISYVHKAEDVMDALQQRAFDLILLDLFLSKNLEGFDLIDDIKSFNRHLPIIIITKDDSRDTTYLAFNKYRVNNIVLKQEINLEVWAEKFDRIIKDNPTRSVFISYSRKDKPFCSYLITKLKEEHFNVEYDEKNIEIGGNIPERIAEAILNCDNYLVVLSNNSVHNSKWVNRELNFAADHKKDNTIIPIKIESFPTLPSFNLLLAGLNVLSFEHVEKEFHKIKENIEYNNWLSSPEINPFEKLIAHLNKGLEKIIEKIEKS